MKRISILLVLLLLVLMPAGAGLAVGADLASADIRAEEVGVFSEGYAPFYADGLCGIVRYDGRVMLEPMYQDVRGYGEKLWPVQTEHGWQFVNMDGTTAIAGPFESAEAFRYGVSIVSVDGKYGAISPSGEFAIPPIWDLITAFNDMGSACASINGAWVLIDAQGAQLTGMYDNITAYNDALIGARDGVYDLLLPDGSVAQTFAADEIGGCADGYVTYRTGDTWQLRTLTGESVWQKRIPADVEYFFMQPAGNGYVLCETLQNATMYDIARNVELGDETWSLVSAPSGGVMRVLYTDGTYGYCDLNGTPVSDERWQSATDFHYGLAVVNDGLELYVVDSDFNEVDTLNGALNAEFSEIGFERGYVVSETDDGTQLTRIVGSAVEGGEFAVANGTLTGYRGEGGDVRIPEGVTAVADEVFRGNESITSIVLPSTLVSIGERAFESCENLGGTVAIPAGVTEIGEHAFTYTAVEAFDVAPENAAYLSWDGGLATLDGVFLCYPAGSDAVYYSLPYNTTRIESYAFARCDSLRYLNIPYSAAEELRIASRAFRNNDSTYIICNRDTRAAQEALDNDIPLLTVYTTPEPTPVPTERPTIIPTPVPTDEPTLIPTANPTQAPSPAPTDIPGETMVYFNVNGVYYHSRSDCSGMKGAGYFTLGDAMHYGKLRCPVCNPPAPTEAPTLEPEPEYTDAPIEEHTALPTVIPTDEPTEEPTAAPTEEPTEAPTIVPTDEPDTESTETPTVIPTDDPAQEAQTMFGPDDLFAGFIQPGMTTRGELEEGLGVVGLSEEALYDEETGMNYTVVNYDFGDASYDEYGVMLSINVTMDTQMPTLRGITMESSVDDVLAAFHQSDSWQSMDSGEIYNEDGYIAFVYVSPEDPYFAITYEYPQGDVFVMDFMVGFWENKISHISMILK